MSKKYIKYSETAWEVLKYITDKANQQDKKQLTLIHEQLNDRIYLYDMRKRKMVPIETNQQLGIY